MKHAVARVRPPELAQEGRRRRRALVIPGLASLLAVGSLLAAGGGNARVAALEVTIRSGPSDPTTSKEAAFAFAANMAGVSFSCSLDGRSASPCASPVRYRGLDFGRHTFKVVAELRRERASDSWTWTITPGPPPPPPPAPSCPTDTICFDDLSPGTSVQSQYKAKGIDLGFNQSDQSGKAGILPTIAADSGAHSDGQIAQVSPCGKEFCSSTIYGRLDHAVHHVEVYAGGGSKVALVGLNAAGVEVAQTSKSTGKDAQTLLAITTLVPQIVYIQIGEDAPPGNQYGQVKLDDLKFDPPDPGAKPDFALHWLPLAPGLPLGISTGSSTSTPIYLTRFNGSTGNIVFSVDPATLPKGLSAKFSPTIVYDTTTTQTTLTVTAAANAATVAPNTKLTVVGHPTSAAVAPADRTVEIPLDVRLSNYDLSVNGIEVNQGIQTQLESYYTSSGSLSEIRCRLLPSLPVRDWTDLSKPVPYETFKEVPVFPASPISEAFGEIATYDELTYLRRYGGVELVAGRKTVARVFATVRSPFGGTVGNVPAVLYGAKNGKALPDSPLSPDDGTKTLSYSELPYTTCAERANPKGGYTFTLPESWTHGKVKLTAAVIPQQTIFGPGAECGSATCAANDSLTLSEVSFTPLSYITVTPVRMTFYVNEKQVNPPDPATVFNLARYVTPGTVYFGDGSGDTWYAGVVDISDEVFDEDLSKNTKDANREQCSEILDELKDWADDNPHGDETVGVFVSSTAVCPGTSDGGSNLLDGHEAFSVVAANRPLTSVAHEMFHGMGRVHASKGCGGNSNDQTGENWPPDERGQIHGIGLDTRAGSGGPYRVLLPAPLVKNNPYKQPAEWIDFMSYCWSSDPGNGIAGYNVWISDGGWNATFDGLKRFQKDVGRLPSAARRPAAGVTLRVTALASAAGVRILTVKPGTGKRLRGGPSPYRLIVRDGAGQVVSDTTMVAAPVHAHDGAPTTLLKAEVTGTGAASLEIVAGGGVVARLRRSPSAPEVKLLAPRAGARVGKGRSVVVQWRAVDADGGRLKAKIDYSTDGGHHFREIFAGPSRGSATLPSSLFAGTHRARVRLRVSDGFNQSVALSKVFIAVGRPPVVRISSPAPSQHVMADAQLYLEGSAYDDTGKLLRGKRLQWFAGLRRLGQGSPVSVTGLPAGRQLIRLVATDARGRRASASVRARIVAVAPLLLAVKAPAKLSPKARRLVLRLSTTIPAHLTAAGKRFDVDRKLKRIVLPVHAGTQALRLRLRLVAAGRATHVTLVIRR
jgi:hypothetical protein